jgi:pimeloyl-ACP methyl ester carboxylesterase
MPVGVRHVVFVFGGLAAGSKRTFDLVSPIFEKLGLGAIYLMDRQKVLFLNGITELASDYEGTLTALRSMLPDTVTTISCFGNSAGGYAALRYAIDLKAASALLVSSPTSVDDEACSRDGRARLVAKRIQKLVPHQAMDLSRLLEQSETVPDVHVWYGGAMPEDREHAGYVAGAPGVTLHEVTAYQGHDVIEYLAATGRLENAVREGLGISNARN